MKQKSVLISVLAILVLLSIYFGFIRKNGAYNDEIDLSLSDTNLVTSIEISDSKTKLKISKPTNKWMVNENYNANNTEVKRLLRIFKNLEVNIIVPENEYDSTLKLIQKNGILISFFKGISKSNYWIGDYDETKKATLMMTDDEIPVYATAPGLTSDIRQFVEPDPLFWRNKRIFDFEPEELNSIDFSDNENQSNSFHILLKGDEYQVLDFNKNPYDFDKEKVLRYISYFKNIDFESVVENLPANQIDSVFKHQPKYEIGIINKNGKKFELKILPIRMQNTQNQYDLNKAYGILNNHKPLLILNYFIIDPLIKQIRYFNRESHSK